MRINLKAAARQQGYRRKRTVFRPVVPSPTLATKYATILLSAGPHIWAAAAPAIVAAYTTALSQLQTDSARDVQTEIDAAAARMNTIFAEITTRTARWLYRVEDWHRKRWVNLIYPTGVDLSTVLTRVDVAETLETVLARNVALIKDVSTQAQGRISDAVFRGLQERTAARDVAIAIEEAVAMSRRRSIGIASDQLQKMTSALDRERMQQMEIDEYEWQHSGKLHPREEHKARNGKTFKLGEPEDEPGELPYCGCKRRPILSMDD